MNEEVIRLTEEDPTPSSPKEMEIIDDDTFSYDGFQVVRGEFFAHIFEPSFTFSGNKVSVNTACIKKLPDTEFVQILVNPEEKKLAVRPCEETERTPSDGVPRIVKNALPSRLPAESFLQRLFLLWIGIRTTVTSC